MKHVIIETSDGSKTIYLPEMDEQYHSVNGALTESKYVYIEKGYSFSKKENPVVFEVGFGTGLNCILTAIEAEKHKRKTYYYSIESFPLEESTTAELNYDSLFTEKERLLFKKIRSENWGELVRVSEYFYLYKIYSRLQDFELSSLKNFDVIYFDAFGPEKQPEMWTPKIFTSIFKKSSAGAVFVTYSAKGEIRRQLNQVGFLMERLPGPPGKKEMLRGIKRD